MNGLEQVAERSAPVAATERRRQEDTERGVEEGQWSDREEWRLGIGRN
jgi:hypothetical protein